MEDMRELKEAVLYERLEGDKVRCNLCNFRCLVGDGKFGNCRVRKNIEGKLYSLNYHKVCSAAVDCIEKKPLFHFLPGTKSFSIACPGCNFKCEFCQNWQISQLPEGELDVVGSGYGPELIVDAAEQNGCASISYTYTEPTIFMELANDCAVLAKKRGLKNVFVSNGYMTREAVDFARGWLDGINVDLKSFNDDFYKNVCKARLEPVLDTIKYIAEKTDIWMEITTLVVPGHNDGDDELGKIAEFVAGLRGGELPWHISRFYPNYEMDNLTATPEERIFKAYQLGEGAGVKYIYIGNMYSKKGENTCCAKCGEEVIVRSGYKILDKKVKNGKCEHCGEKISGIF